MSNTICQRKAFTLIEVLIVLAIIGILSAIIFPVLGHVRENGRKTTCQSNLRQLSLALQQYVADNSGTLPLWWNANYNPSTDAPPLQGGVCWTNRMLPYFKVWDLVHCPSKGKDRLQEDVLDQLDPVGKQAGRPDYFFNSNLTALNETSISIPVNVVTFGDSMAFFGQMYTSGIYRQGGGGDRHFDGANYAFYDGHVKWIGVETNNIRSGEPGKSPQCNPQHYMSMCPY